MAKKRLDLLLKEIADPYVQENFYKLKTYIENLTTSGGGTGTQGLTGPAGPAGLQGPQGIPGVADFFKKITDSIPAGATKIIDTVPLVNFRLLEYTFRASNSPNTKTKGLKMTVRVTDSTVSDQVYSRGGDAINMSIDATISGPNVNLVLQNFEAFTLNYGLIRATL